MRELNTVDLFCGAGGASTGMEDALRHLKLAHRGLAIDHWAVAVDTMRANHPDIDTKQMSIEEVIPADLVPSGEVDLLWASPSCTHHSRAKGGKPRSNQLRAQPELVLTWLDQLFVRRIIIENVPEFVDWGPLAKDGRPIERLKGSCFRSWVAAIEARNYTVEWRIVNCADYGDATSRRRFFLKAVRKGCGKIRWPEPTHAENPQPDLFGRELKKWRGVRECLDLSDTGNSIFNRKKPLAKNTLRRIAVGLRKFCGLDFQMDMLGAGENDETRVLPTTAPLRTQHTANRTAIIRPFMVRMNKNCDADSGHIRTADKPIQALTTCDNMQIAIPVIVDMSHPGDKNDERRVMGGDEPIHTITTRNNSAAVMLPVLEDGRVIDIRIRMLKPSELAAAHSFPADYILTGNRGEQVKQIGNSVPVKTAAAMCEADLREVSR